MDKIVLVIEDYEPLVRAINQKLEKKGITCLVAKSVSESMEILLAHPEIKLIWLDHFLLGDKNGLDFLTELREMKQYEKLPVIVVSNETQPEYIKAYKDLGTLEYFVKVENTLSEIVGKVVELLG